VVTKAERTRRGFEELDDATREVKGALDRILAVAKEMFPAPIPRLNFEVPFNSDEVMISFERPVRVPAYVISMRDASPLESEGGFYVSHVKVEVDRYFGLYLHSLFYDRDGSWLVFDNPEALVLLFTPELFQALEGARIESKKRVGAEWFKSLVEVAREVSSSGALRNLKARDLVEPGDEHLLWREIARVTVMLWDPLRDGSSSASIAVRVYQEKHTHDVVDFSLRLGNGTYFLVGYFYDKKRPDESFLITRGSRKQVLDYARRALTDSFLESVVKSFESYAEAYKLVNVALKYINL